MRRKLAFGVAVVMTVVLMICRLGVLPGWNELKIGAMDSGYLMIAIVAATAVILFLLCFDRRAKMRKPVGKWATVGGWFATFSGTVLLLSALLDLFSWIVYGQVPPPNTVILNNTDLITLLFTLFFGLLGGAALMLEGFCWMSNDSQRRRTLRRWLSLAPVLWVWFRLARYEVSYASTAEIDESFFDFATLIFMLLFLLFLAQFVAKVGKPPRTALLFFSLMAMLVSLSGAPVTLTSIADGQALGTLLIAIVDTVFGLFALYIAVLQVFGPTTAPSKKAQAPASPFESVKDALAWTEEPPAQPPLDPPFHIDAVMPPAEEIAAPTADAQDTMTQAEDATPIEVPAQAAPVEAPINPPVQASPVQAAPAKAPTPITPRAAEAETAVEAATAVPTVEELLNDIDDLRKEEL